MSDLVKQLRKEAARNAQMQGDKEHQTNRRRKTFRGRNRLFTKAADRIAELEARIDAVKKCPIYFEGGVMTLGVDGLFPMDGNMTAISVFEALKEPING